MTIQLDIIFHFIMFVTSVDSNFAPLCVCGRVPMKVHYATKCVGYWIKNLQMPNERYPSHAKDSFASRNLS